MSSQVLTLALAVAILNLYIVSVVSLGGLLGGYREHNLALLTDEENNYFQNAADQAVVLMNNANLGSGVNTQPIQFQGLESVKTQVIAGTNFDMTVKVLIDGKTERCHLLVSNRVDNKVEGGTWSVQAMSSDDPCAPFAPPPAPVHHVHIQKRSAHLLGGDREVSVNDRGVSAAVQWALEQINAQSNSLFRQGLLRVEKITKQVINGYRYRFTISTVTTECMNKPENKHKGLEECPISKSAKAQDCEVSVIHSIAGEYRMEHFSCQPSTKPILGGDDHDLKPHGLFGQDGHGVNPLRLLGKDGHGVNPLGKDSHGVNPLGLLGKDGHGVNPLGLLGKDGHGVNPLGLLGKDGHGVNPLGKDSHGVNPKGLLGKDGHGVNPLGKDGHDFVNHHILGGDGHDLKPHGLFGHDGHGLKPQGLMGQDDHDYVNHHKLMGNEVIRSIEDFLPKGRPYFATPEDMKLTSLKFKSELTDVKVLGGDNHDFVPHGGKCVEHKEAFEKFKAEHNKLYGSPREEAKRFMVFCENMEKVKNYQSQEQGSAVYGATKFADLTETEFKKQYLGLKLSIEQQATSWPQAEIPQGPVPESWDWRDHGAVTPVKNQGSCGSCWAFSTTGNVEGQWAIVNKKLFSLSEQELVDCDKLDEGCNGGLPTLAYESIMKLGGLETEKDYHYDGYNEGCKFNRSKVVASLSGAVNISQNEDEMAAWLYKNGPISIGINAFAMQFYWGGVAHPWKIFCSPKDLDHGVLIVGYGVEKGEPYWIVKNSWGADWGRQGYYYVYRGDGTCGLNTMCTSAQVKKQ